MRSFGGGPHQAHRITTSARRSFLRFCVARHSSPRRSGPHPRALRPHGGCRRSAQLPSRPALVGNNPVSAPTTHCSTRPPASMCASFHCAPATHFLRPSQVTVWRPFVTTSRPELPTTTRCDALAYGATSVMLEGDAEALSSRHARRIRLASTLLKVGHHGSITSTRPEFLARVAPQWAVISCGLRNRYGHPRIEVLQELEAAGFAPFQLTSTALHAFDSTARPPLRTLPVAGVSCLEAN